VYVEYNNDDLRKEIGQVTVQPICKFDDMSWVKLVLFGDN